MKIASVGHNFKHDKAFSILRPHGLDGYLLLIIRSSAVVEIEKESFRVKPQSMILFDKHMPHNLYADSDLYVNDWIEFDLTDEEYTLFIENKINLNTFFTSSDVLFCSDIVKLVQQENHSDGIGKDDNVIAFLKIILRKLYENSDKISINNKYYGDFKKIRNMIYSAPTQNYSIDLLADNLHLSKSYFQHLYKLYFNTTPIADAINSRIEYSKQLLVSTDYSVADIAEKIGYQNDMQFIKQFKLKTHTTPLRYRKNREITDK